MTIYGYAGRAAVFSFGGTQYETYYRTLDQSENEDQIDTTAGAQTWDVSIGGDKHGEWNFELIMPAGADGSTTYAAFVVGTEGTAIIGPEGTTAGNPCSTVYCRVISRARPLNRADATTFAVSLKYNDADGPTDSAYS